MKEYLLKIFNYNHWANEVLIENIKKYNIDDEYINKMISHLINVLFIRYENIDPKHKTPFQLWDIHPLEKLIEANNNISEDIITYLSTMKPREAVAKIHSTSTDGEEIMISKGDMFIHMVNHAAHHRGQICKRMRELGHTPPGIGYLRYAISFPDFW